jgi:hypothetical protein
MKRLSDRISVEFEAKLILNKTRYDGVINNISEDGICMILRKIQIFSQERHLKWNYNYPQEKS